MHTLQTGTWLHVLVLLYSGSCAWPHSPSADALGIPKTSTSLVRALSGSWPDRDEVHGFAQAGNGACDPDPDAFKLLNVLLACTLCMSGRITDKLCS